jgi:hypothetical protein
MPAISMTAPMTMSTTAIQTKGVMAAPLLGPRLLKPRIS